MTPELAVTLVRNGEIALPQQLVTAVRGLIRDRVLLPGEVMPATRVWAQQLGVSRGTVVTAYDQLTAEGYLIATPGAATRVNPALKQTHPETAATAAKATESGTGGRGVVPLAHPASAAPPVTINMLPGQSSTEHLSTPTWRRVWRQAASGEFVPAPPAGAPEFLAAVSEHFRRMRGLARPPQQFLATAGAREGLALLVLTLSAQRPGRALRVGVEAPGYPSLRLTLQRLGCNLIPLPVDEQGLRTDLLSRQAAPPDLVIVTPSHQYPFGGSLPIARRLELLEWARDQSVILVEDDYDSELRYVGSPLPTLAALDDPRAATVVLLGTFATTVAPGIGIGAMCVPDALRPKLVATREDLGTAASTMVQRAFASYLDSGELTRRSARMRRVYRQRRAAVLEAFATVKHLTVSPMDGGLHAVIHSQHDEAGMLAACSRAHVAVEGGAEYWHCAENSPRDNRGGSIVIGYAHLSDAQLARGLARLRAAL